MTRFGAQLSRRYRVVEIMSSVAPRNPSHARDAKHKPETVAMPSRHEGVRQALLGSFSIPPMPQEFIRLLERLR
jgi:hypothetical protein